MSFLHTSSIFYCKFVAHQKKPQTHKQPKTPPSSLQAAPFLLFYSALSADLLVSFQSDGLDLDSWLQCFWNFSLDNHLFLVVIIIRVVMFWLSFHLLSLCCFLGFSVQSLRKEKNRRYFSVKYTCVGCLTSSRLLKLYRLLISALREPQISAALFHVSVVCSY